MLVVRGLCNRSQMPQQPAATQTYPAPLIWAAHQRNRPRKGFKKQAPHLQQLGKALACVCARIAARWPQTVLELLACASRRYVCRVTVQ